MNLFITMENNLEHASFDLDYKCGTQNTNLVDWIMQGNAQHENNEVIYMQNNFGQFRYN